MKNYWLYIEPYVYIAVNSNESLIYNTLSGKHFYSKNKNVSKFFLELKSERNIYVIDFDKDNIVSDLTNVIDWLLDTYSGDIVPKSISLEKPFIFYPFLNMKKKLLLSNQDETVGNYVYPSVFKLCIYLSSECDCSCSNCSEYYKQFDFCKKNRSKNILSLKDIEFIIDRFNNKYLIEIDFFGGNIFLYSFLKELLEYLQFLNVKIVFNINVKTILNFDTLLLFKHNKMHINLLVCKPYNTDYLLKISDFLSVNGISYSIKCVVENENDCVEIESQINLDNVFLFPFYNNELSFFEKNVMLEKDDILNNKIYSRLEIVRNLIVNTNFFGKMIVDANANIYLSFLDKPIANVYSDNLIDILNILISENSLWRYTRDKVEPCNNCVFNCFCPPISNYELRLKKNNLCFIK